MVPFRQGNYLVVPRHALFLDGRDLLDSAAQVVSNVGHPLVSLVLLFSYFQKASLELIKLRCKKRLDGTAILGGSFSSHGAELCLEVIHHLPALVKFLIRPCLGCLECVHFALPDCRWRAVLP